MKIVLDTNVLVSGLLSPFGAAGEIVRLAAAGAFELCYDARIFSEYREVLLRPKFCFDRTHVDYLLEQIEACGCIVAAKPLSKRLPDPDDEPFLEAAIAGNARYLVTGNLKHFSAAEHRHILFVPPAQFLKIFRTPDFPFL